jgi:hypothetical protein
MASLKELLFGKKERFEQLPRMIPEQQQLLSQLLGGVRETLPPAFESLKDLLRGRTETFETPMISEFEQQIVPSIAERFTGMGAGAQQSSAFRQALGEAGAGLTERLASLREGLKMQGLGQLSSLLMGGLGAQPFETLYRPATSGFLGGMAPGVGQATGFGLLKLLGIV